jgi:hypothetical protein
LALWLALHNVAPANDWIDALDIDRRVVTWLQKERKADFPPAEVRINVVDVTRPRAKKRGVIKSPGR